ncbi:flagellin lysine-N-methylase [Aeromonas caviae]|uniref:flagellin lysine-N-methylase n=1 Tax=Aeromonas TaxID=642 RepID=UPI00225B6EBA|nr:flagellin lysine-N-methylase [Aeromonas caviae]MCX4035605.1 flagellin lysine-N-methylase [Aeromonas caviae]
MAASLYTPHFVQHFQCIGDRCEDNCCHSWTISIDKQTFRSYERHPDPTVKSLSKLHIIKVKQSNERWGEIKLDEQGACPFLDENRLCQIHSKAGPDALSHTCKTYPRAQTRIGNQLKRSLMLSCPQVCRQLLLDPLAMQTEVTELTQPLPFAPPPSNAMATLHSLSIHVLAATDIPVAIRLWLVGMLIHRDPAQLSHEAFLDQVAVLAERGELNTMFEQLPALPRLQWWGLRTMTHQLLAYSQGRRGRQTMQVCLDKINEVLEGTYDEDKLARLQQVWHDRVAPFLASHPQILDNYLLYYVYHHNFPLQQGDKCQAYQLLVVDYFLLRNYLCLLAMDKELDEQDVVNLFYSYHTIRQHNASFIKTIEQGLNDSGFASDISLYALLKP